MKVDAVFSMSFRNAEEAEGIEDVMAASPYRAYKAKNHAYILQYDIGVINGVRSQKRIANYVKIKGKSGPSIIIDVPVFFPNRLASKRFKIPKKLLLFAQLSGAENRVFDIQNGKITRVPVGPGARWRWSTRGNDADPAPTKADEPVPKSHLAS